MSDTGRLGEILHGEHRQTLEAMNTLENRILGASKTVPLDGGDPDDAELVKALLSVIERDIERHFRFEEDELFPELAARGLADLAASLTQEHEAVLPMAAALKALLERARGSALTPEDWSDFRDTAMDFVHSLLFHIQKEETALVRRLGFLLKDDTDERLASIYAASRS